MYKVKTLPVLRAGPREQMRRDLEAAEEVSRSGEAIVRAGVWDPPGVSLGRRQAPAGPYDPERLAEMGLGVVVRPTGGLMILHHHGTFTLHIVLPSTHPIAGLGVVEAAQELARAIAAALRAIGLEAWVPGYEGRRRLVPRETGICMAYRGAGDVFHGERKAGALALRRGPGYMLAQAYVIAGDPDYRLWALVDEYPVPEELSRAFTGYGAVLGKGGLEAVVGEVARRLREYPGGLRV